MLDKRKYIEFLTGVARNELIIEIKQLEQFLEEIKNATPDETSIHRMNVVKEKIHIMHDELQQVVM